MTALVATLLGEPPLKSIVRTLHHPLAQARATCITDHDLTASHLLLPSSARYHPFWADRYFEKQHLAHCGMHALNNLVGGPQFIPLDLQTACAQMCAETGEMASDHSAATGWYSHSVLATALQLAVPPRWRLQLNPMLTSEIHLFLSD